MSFDAASNLALMLFVLSEFPNPMENSKKKKPTRQLAIFSPNWISIALFFAIRFLILLEEATLFSRDLS